MKRKAGPGSGASECAWREDLGLWGAFAEKLDVVRSVTDEVRIRQESLSTINCLLARRI
ncbi:hypothetical protein [Pedosphaera parvula]|uniref:hypothetical protein n=1 Tax=Pedosphaera parvula TaxID=1032527 RepID=UPI00031FA085|nr:hypothetical protein [Pedosphaera parvula]